MSYGSFAYGAVEIAGQQTPITVPTPPAQKRFTLFIAGVDRTSLMIVNTLNGTNPLSQAATCNFTVEDPAGAFHPTMGMDVQVFSNTTKIFGGLIDSVEESAYQALPRVRAEVRCIDYSGLFDRRVVANFYTGFSMSSIVSDLVQKFLSADGIVYNATDGDPGTTLGDILFPFITARQAFNQLSSSTGWEFSVDYNKVLRFFPPGNGTANAPFNLADNDGNVLAVGGSGGTGQSATVRVFRGNYMNRVFVTSSSQASALWVDIFSAAIPGPYPSNKQAPGGGRIAFVTLFKLEATPVVLKNGSPQRVISLSQVGSAAPGSYDFYWIPDGSGVFAAVAPVSTDVIEVDYQTRLSPATVATCAAEVTARASAEGNSGYYDAVIPAQNITDPTALKNFATFLLNRYGCTNGLPKQVIYSTIKDGLFAGMLQTINLTQPLIPSHAYLLSGVTWKDVDKDHIEYQVTCDFGQYLANTSDQFFAGLVNRGQLPQPANFQTYTWPIAPTLYPSYVNPGMPNGGTLPITHIIRNQVEMPQYVSVVFNSLPANPGANFQLLWAQPFNGIGAQLVPLVSQAEVRYYFPPGANAMHAGDAFQILVQGTPSASYKDGTFTLVTSVMVN